jgi:hypothetical protein
VLPGVIGLVQATEAIKVLIGIGEPLIGRLLTYDALGMRFREVKLRRDAKCPLCGTNPTITDLSIHAHGAAACGVSSANGEPVAAGVRESAQGPGEAASAGRGAASGPREPASLGASGSGPRTAPGARAEGVTARTGC